MKIKPMRVEFDLWSPDFGDFHQSGLAGLWMTLDALGIEFGEAYGASWTLAPDGVVLDMDRPHEFVDALLRAGLALDEDGVFVPAGWAASAPDRWADWCWTTGVRASLYQHPRVGVMIKESIAFHLGEGRVVQCRPLSGLAAWNLPKKEWRTLLSGGSRSGVALAKSWLLPGASGGVAQSLAQLLALAFLPVGGVALQLEDIFRPRHEGALVVPTAIDDLAAYATARRRVASWANPGATSYEDAALRVHAELGQPVESWAYGKGPATRQRVRLARVRTDHVEAARLRTWAELERVHPMRGHVLDEGWTFLRGARLRGAVAEGLCGADPDWWRAAVRWLHLPGEAGQRAWNSLAWASGRTLWRLAFNASSSQEAT